MVEIPPVTATMEDLVEWERVRKQIADLRAIETALRAKIVKAWFADSKVGTNKMPLNGGWELHYKRSLDRKVDEAVLHVLRPSFQEKGINVDSLLRTKLELDARAYNKLDEDKKLIFDQALIIKDASPVLEIVAPKG